MTRERYWVHSDPEPPPHASTGQPATPSTYDRVCVLCSARGRERKLEVGHVCRACTVGLDVDLAALVEAAAIAGRIPDPLASRPSIGRRSTPASRPPLDLAHVDPALVLVRAEVDDPSSDEPLLVLLESWCRAVREDRGLVPYGVATEGREVTLAEVVGFLRVHVAWMTTEPTFGIEQLAGHVRRGLSALRALDPGQTREPTWTVPCPADKRTA